MKSGTTRDGRVRRMIEGEIEECRVEEPGKRVSLAGMIERFGFEESLVSIFSFDPAEIVGVGIVVDVDVGVGRY